MSTEIPGRIVGEQSNGRPLWKFCALETCAGHTICQECWKAYADWKAAERKLDRSGVEQLTEAIGAAESCVSELFDARERLKGAAHQHSHALRVLTAIGNDLRTLPALSDLDRFHLRAIDEVLQGSDS